MKLLIIGFVWPEPNSSAAGIRMMQLINAFKSHDYNITFACAAANIENAVDLEKLGIVTKNIKLNHPSFDAFVKKLSPDVVLFDRFMTEEQFGWRVNEQCPNAMRILDSEDLHSLRKVRQELLKAKEEFTFDKWLKADITKREIASIYRCDLSLIISDFEIQLLSNKIGIDKSLLLYSPFMFEPISNTGIMKLPSFQERQDFITIGNFRHEPNLDSVLYLKETIWPLIRKELSQASMVVHGSYPIGKVNQLQNEKEGFLIKGWAQDADEVMKKARVCLAPLRFGAGLKGKFVIAMRNGTPSVTTGIGAEGFTADFGGFVENNPNEIAQKAIDLYRDESSWKEKQDKGFNMVNSSFDRSQLINELIDRVNTTLGRLEELRLQNFTGTMLHHQTLRSTKYMSKWIESKQNS